MNKPIVYIDMDNVLVDVPGEHIHFQTDPRFPDWQSVCDYLISIVT